MKADWKCNYGSTYLIYEGQWPISWPGPCTPRESTWRQFDGSSSGSDSRDGSFGEQKRLLALPVTEGQSLGLLVYNLDTTWTTVSRLPFVYTCLVAEFTKIMKFSYRSTYIVVERAYQLLQFEQTNAHNFIKVTINTPAPTYFGPHLPIIRERTIVNNKCFISSARISRKSPPFVIFM